MSSFATQLKLGQHAISAADQPYLIAEIGLNHNRDMKLAAELIAAAAEAGANAVKFQSYTTDLFVNPNDDEAKGLADIFRQYELSFEQHQELARLATKNQVDFFSTPLTLDWPGRLRELGAAAMKIASGDVLNFALLEEVIAQGLPIIASTGAASWAEISRAVDFYKERDKSDVIFLHCISMYPTPEEQTHLATIPALAGEFGCLAGFSDHTAGVDAAFVAASLGAVVYEKHFTLDHDLDGPDHKLSATPVQLKTIRESLDRAHAMRGSVRREALEPELAGDVFGKRSLYEVDGKLVPMRPRRPNLPRDSDYFEVN